MQSPDALKAMTKEALLAALPKLAKGEREQLVVLLDYLGELEDRRAHEEAGYSSLWDYARRALLFSEMQASLRVRAARAIRGRPALRVMLADGRLSLCTLSTLAPCLGDGNAEELIAKAAYKGKREVEDLVAARMGNGAPKRDVIRCVGPEVPATATVGAATVPAAPSESPSPARQNPVIGIAVPAAASPIPAVIPTERQTIPAGLVGAIAVAPTHANQAPLPSARVAGPDKSGSKNYRISFSASKCVAEKLKLLQELLGAADLSDVVDRAAEALLDAVDPVRRARRRKARKAKKMGASASETTKAKETVSRRPAEVSPVPVMTSEPRRAPLAMADDIKVRDAMQCSYVASDGTRCAERRHLEIDHVLAFGYGGKTTLENQRLLCKQHNLMFARRAFPGKVPTRPGAVAPS